MTSLQTLSEEYEFELCELCEDAIPVTSLMYTGDRYPVPVCGHCLLDFVQSREAFNTFESGEVRIPNAEEKIAPILKAASEKGTSRDFDYETDEDLNYILMTLYGEALAERDSE